MDRKFGIVGGTGKIKEGRTPDLVDKVFQAFVRANEIRPERRFGKPAEYPFGGLHYNEEELRQTPDFQGFIDGYHQRVSRYQGAFGTALRAEKASPFAEEIDDLLEGIVKRAGEKSIENAAQLRAQIERVRPRTERERYEDQYTLGRSCAPR
jgi:hypothetical protein